MSDDIIPITGVGYFGTSDDGQGVTFGFDKKDGGAFRAKCHVDGFEDILNQLVMLFDLANEKRGAKPIEAGESGTARMHQIVGYSVGVTENRQVLLMARTAANTKLNLVLTPQQTQELEKLFDDARTTIEGMTQDQKH